jgi:hypothetical protein
MVVLFSASLKKRESMEGGTGKVLQARVVS